MGEIILTRHAVKRCRQRGIRKEFVAELVASWLPTEGVTRHDIPGMSIVVTRQHGDWIVVTVMSHKKYKKLKSVRQRSS